MIDWKKTSKILSDSDHHWIQDILDRAWERALPIDRVTIAMSLEACNYHLPLDFEKLAKAGSGDFSHDIMGIVQHIDEETGELRDGFVPRFKKR